MKEITITQHIKGDVIRAENQIESFINDKIRDALVKRMETALDEMAFTDMEYDPINDIFDVEASIVLCTTQDIATNAELQAQLMAKNGLNEEIILEILSLGLQDTKGF